MRPKLDKIRPIEGATGKGVKMSTRTNYHPLQKHARFALAGQTFVFWHSVSLFVYIHAYSLNYLFKDRSRITKWVFQRGTRQSAMTLDYVIPSPGNQWFPMPRTLSTPLSQWSQGYCHRSDRKEEITHGVKRQYMAFGNGRLGIYALSLVGFGELVDIDSITGGLKYKHSPSHSQPYS